MATTYGTGGRVGSAQLTRGGVSQWLAKTVTYTDPVLGPSGSATQVLLGDDGLGNPTSTWSLAYAIGSGGAGNSLETKVTKNSDSSVTYDLTQQYDAVGLLKHQTQAAGMGQTVDEHFCYDQQDTACPKHR